MFGTILISVTTLMHVYVFARAATLPWVVQYIPRAVFISSGILLWLIFVLGRVWGHHNTGIPAAFLEFIGMNWMGTLLLIFTLLVCVDVLTVFGYLLPSLTIFLRSMALAAGLIMAAAALVQGLRPPVVETYEVTLPDLPIALDGTVIAAMSDLHLGSQLGRDWFKARITQVNSFKPDLIVLLGDIFEGHGMPGQELINAFRQLSAPMGSWAVLGNHEFYGVSYNAAYDQAGIRLLRNTWAEAAPGLILAGVDDLTILHRIGQKKNPVAQALENRPPGAAILLSHTPWQVEKAAAKGAGMVLSGHTHAGQIWPFGYLVRQRYPLIEGRYDVNGMTVIVSRGAGTWGPRMRLWKPGEILCITLRAVKI